ncbi:MAG: flavin reductase family protein [Rhodobacteraceae bacterium]|nr:flavin reductase family protein [Paracoccaceae bacterium]
MFYRPGIDNHGLPHNPFKAIVAPRPIGWISSLDVHGRSNLAPYSFFNGVGDDPPMVMYSTTGPKIGVDEGKDSISNIRATREFCVSVVSSALRDAMNISSGSYAAGEDEFEMADLPKGTARVVAPPFVAHAPASLECKLHRIVNLPGDAVVVFGQVVGIHIREEHLKDGLLDVTGYQPLARLGYRDYTAVTETFSLNRPGQT